MHIDARSWQLHPGVAWGAVALLLLLMLAGIVPALRPPPLVDAQPTLTLVQALRSDATGPARQVGLPDEIEAAASATLVTARYQVDVELGAQPRRLALYASGLVGSARIRLNGAVLVDDIAEPPRPAPRGIALLRLIDLPDALLRPGVNHIDIDIAGRRTASLSVLRIGDRGTLASLRDGKALAMVIGPAIVATVIGCLGLSMLVLYLRRRSEALYGYFGLGAILWSVHTFWTVSPQGLLTGMHLTVWWNTLYVAVVVMLVLFCLRYAQRSRPRIELTLLAVCAVTPGLLYAAAALGALRPAAEAARLTLVLLAAMALGAVAHHAWHRRRADSALLVLAGLTGAGFGLRDWLVFRSGADNLPVPLTPYAGLPFILLVSALLIERFVRTTERLEGLNQQLDERVARREGELRSNYERLAALERAHATTDERQRIMRELHDGLGAKLVATLLRVESAELDRAGLAQELRACLTDMRLATETLTPDKTELGAVIGNFLFRWEGLLRDAGVRATWQVELPAEGVCVAPYVALQLLRVMQEALSNVLRHADASRVRLALTHDGTTLALSIDDDGRGIELAQAPVGHGVDDMRSRAAAVGARFAIATPPGGGTRVALQLALPA